MKTVYDLMEFGIYKQSLKRKFERDYDRDARDKWSNTVKKLLARRGSKYTIAELRELVCIMVSGTDECVMDNPEEFSSIEVWRAKQNYEDYDNVTSILNLREQELRYKMLEQDPEDAEVWEFVACKLAKGDTDEWYEPSLRRTLDNTTFFNRVWDQSRWTPVTEKRIHVLKSYGIMDRKDDNRMNKLSYQFICDFPPKSGLKDSAGWLAPDGTFYPCEYGAHAFLTGELVELLYQEYYQSYGDYGLNDYACVRVLDELGWVRVDANFIGYKLQPTDKQLITLTQLYYMAGNYLNKRVISSFLHRFKWEVN